jgi:hypothetical protein
MAKFDANAISNLDWKITGGRFEQEFEPAAAGLAECVRSTDV